MPMETRPRGFGVTGRPGVTEAGDALLEAPERLGEAVDALFA